MRASVATSAAGKRQASWSVVIPLTSPESYQSSDAEAFKPYADYLASIREEVLSQEAALAEAMTERYPNAGGEA